MAVTTITYNGPETVDVTGWDSALATQEYGSSGIYSNTSNKYVDILVGGFIDFTGTSAVAGDSIDIYVTAQHTAATATDMGGGVGALLLAVDEPIVNTEFIQANLTLVQSIQLHAATPATAQGYHWGPIGMAQFFGGVLPEKVMWICHANTASSLAGADAADLQVVGITYTTTA